MRSDWNDRFADMALKEILGGETPPSVRERVLARVPAKPTRLRRLAVWAAAAAVLLAAGLGMRAWLADPQKPDPTAATTAKLIRGDVKVDGGGELKRGALARTATAGAELLLGNYAAVTMQPNTAIKLGGDDDAEEVELEAGAVECDVAQAPGKEFTVRAAECGQVKVLGTHFRVELQKEKDEMNVKRMMVTVMTGAVLVIALQGDEVMLNAGEKAEVTPQRVRKFTIDPEDFQAMIKKWQYTLFGEHLGKHDVYLTDDPEQMPQASVQLQLAALKDKVDTISQRILKTPEITEAMNASLAAATAFQDALLANEDYKLLAEEAERRKAELNELTRPQVKDRDAFKEYLQQRREKQNEINTFLLDMATFHESVPTLKKLYEAREAASLAFYKIYVTTLLKDAAYQEVAAKLKTIRDWQQDTYQRRRAEHHKKHLDQKIQRAENHDANNNGDEAQVF